MSRKISLEIHWEPYFALYSYSSLWEENDPLVEEPTYYLLDLLRRHNIKAIWYVLGWLEDKRNDLLLAIKNNGHEIGYHSYYHTTDPADISSDRLYRSPRWKGEKRLYSGGFFLRAMPYWWIKREVLKTGIFFIHPHDILFKHPKLPNPFHNLKRQIGLKTSRDKLERLCREVEFETFVPEPAIA